MTSKCECRCPDSPPKTRFVILLAIGVGLIFLSFWGMDWAMAKQASGQPVDVMGYTMSASYWWNVNWLILFVAIIIIIYSSIKIAWMKCRGEF